jgi:signal transduction histidine kinase
MKRVSLFLQLILAVLAGCSLAILVVVPTLKPPEEDIKQLFLFMFLTGMLTVSLAYVLYRYELLQRFLSLRWSLFSIIALTVLLIFVNVWIIARMMYISEHDLVLTTALLVFSGVIAVVSAMFVARTLGERIYDLSAGIRALTQGDLKTRLVVSGNDELANLGARFNDMAKALEELDHQKQQLEQTRRDLIAWVSHDLRTPLAAMRAMNEAMLDGVVSDPDTVRRYQQNIEGEIQHLSWLIDDLFELAQLDTGRLKLNLQATSLHDLVSDTLSGMNARAVQQGIQLSASVDADVDTIYAAPDKIQRVIYNLLDNALQYTPPNGQVTLHARRTPTCLEISVHNTGSYIAPADLPHVFDSFYRGEQSRSKAEHRRRGTGLGLAIVRGLVEAHSGSIRVESQPERGTTFAFTLPLNPSDS